MTKILSDRDFSGTTIINDRYIVFHDGGTGYSASIVAYDYLHNTVKEQWMSVCGACAGAQSLLYSNRKYYFFEYNHHENQYFGEYMDVYDSNLELIGEVKLGSLEPNIKSDPNVVHISYAVEGLKNFSEKIVAVTREHRKSILKDKICTENDYLTIIEKTFYATQAKGLTVNDFGPFQVFYLIDKNAGKSASLVGGYNYYSASRGTRFAASFIDTQNEIISIYCRSGIMDSYFIVDFKGNILGETDQFVDDDLDLVPIEHYLFLINYTKGTITSYDLRNQNRNTISSSETIDGIKINFMRGSLNQNPGQYAELTKSHIFADVFDIVDINIDSGLLIATMADSSSKTWDLNTGKLLTTKYVFDENTEVTVTPEGYFSGKGSYEDKIHFVDDKLNSYSFSQFVRRFYRPEAVQLALSGESLTDIESIDSILAKQKAPSINIILPDRKIVTSKDTALVKVKVKDNGGGVGDIYIYVNEVLVSTDTMAIDAVSKGEYSVFSFNIGLSEGDNRIKVIAYNKTNTMSSVPDNTSITTNYKFDAPSLYVLAVGIDTYENDELNLKYAVADMEMFTKNIEELSEPLFKSIKMIPLGKPQDTTKEAISKAFKRLAIDVKAGDYFIFYQSSHGYMASFGNGDSKFYLITSNVIFVDPQNLNEHAISQDELVTLIGNVPAQNKIMFLDTCQSGEAGRVVQIAMAETQKTYTRALSAATAMELLKIASGTSVFTASQRVESAIEGYKGHGLFTYTLIEGMKGMADENQDKYITLGELKGYVERGVFNRSQEYFKIRQVPYINIGTLDLSIARVR